jgi:hypothetical protein
MIKGIMRNAVFNCMTTVTCCKKCRLLLTLRSISNKLCPKMPPCIDCYHHMSRGWINLTESAMWRLYLGRYWIVTMLVLTLIPIQKSQAIIHLFPIVPLSGFTMNSFISLYLHCTSMHTHASNCCGYLVFASTYICTRCSSRPLSDLARRD